MLSNPEGKSAVGSHDIIINVFDKHTFYSSVNSGRLNNEITHSSNIIS